MEITLGEAYKWWTFWPPFLANLLSFVVLLVRDERPGLLQLISGHREFFTVARGSFLLLLKKYCRQRGGEAMMA